MDRAIADDDRKLKCRILESAQRKLFRFRSLSRMVSMDGQGIPSQTGICVYFWLKSSDFLQWKNEKSYK